MPLISIIWGNGRMTDFWHMVDFYKCMSSKHNTVLEIKAEQSDTVSAFTSLQSEGGGDSSQNQ